VTVNLVDNKPAEVEVTSSPASSNSVQNPASKSAPAFSRKAEGHPPEWVMGESLRFAYDTFLSNRVRFMLTALGMMIGTASLVLVVTIGMTGKQYILDQIQGIGANLIYASYAGAGHRITAVALDELTVDDVAAVREQVPSVVAASPFTTLNDRISVGNGKEQDISILGVFPEYVKVRNLVLLAGRFFDSEAQQGRRDHREAGAEAFREPYQRGRPGDQAERLAVHGDWSFQGTGRNVWAVGSGRQYDGDSVLGEPFFSALQCCKSDLFFGGEPR
jgi:hypothetical protein